jgi:ADP-ribose pyrophosphatase
MNPAPKTILHRGRFLALVKEGHWEYADRTNATGAAIIARTIELPAGIIGDELANGDEVHAEAARRELLEETGYDAEHIAPLTHGPASSGLTSETVTLFLATKLRHIGPGGGVGHEEIVVHEVPLAEVHGWLEAKARDGVLVDPKIYAGLYFIGRNK